MATMKRIPILLPPGDAEALAALSAERGSPVAELVRRAVRAWLDVQVGTTNPVSIRGIDEPLVVPRPSSMKWVCRSKHECGKTATGTANVNGETVCRICGGKRP